MYFCSICLDYAKEKGSIATKAASKPERAVTTQKVADKNNSVLKVVKLIKNDKIKNDEMNLLRKTIGESIAKNISTRIQNDSPKTHYNNLNDTMNKDFSSHKLNYIGGLYFSLINAFFISSF